MGGSLVACVFCQRDGVKLTGEHLWGDWLSREFPEIAEESGHVITRPGEPEISWRRGTFTATLREVCGECNSGWMNDLENDAKPLLVRMFKGESVELGRTAQARLAAWSYKTAVVFARMNQAAVTVPRAHLDGLFARHLPPEQVTIWAGFHLPRTLEDGDIMVTEARVQPTAAMPHAPEDALALFAQGTTYGVTLGLGCVAVQVVGTDIPEADPLAMTFHRPDSPYLRRLWPTRSLWTWPPPASLDAVGGLTGLPLRFWPRLPAAFDAVGDGP